MNEVVESIIKLLVGCAVFITGMNMMSAGLKKATGRGLKSLLRKIQNNRFAGLGIGAAVTALIQSSGATAVMVIGFINAGVMSLFQGVSIILGSFIGTTVTGVLASLSSFSIGNYLLLLAVIGVILMYFKNEKVKHIGEILCGLGLLFFGLETMKGAFGSGTTIYEFTKDLFGKVTNPVLLLLIGCVFTALVQSSSATSGIVIVMVGSNTMPLSSGFYLVLGATVGTVITTIIGAIGGNTNAKRIAFISLVIKVITATIGTVIVYLFSEQLSTMFMNAFQTAGFAVAMFLVIYSAIFFSAMLPFITPLIKLSELVIKDKPNKNLTGAVKYIDDRLLNTPTVAMMQVKKEIINMMELSKENLERGYYAIVKQDLSNEKNIDDTEEKIDHINKEIASYLIKLSPNVEIEDERKIGSYFHVINDVERIGDHAVNFEEYTKQMMDDELVFSEEAIKGLDKMYGVLSDMYDLTMSVFTRKDKRQLVKLTEMEQEVDSLKKSLTSEHFERIAKNACKVELTSYYSSLISELERVGAHILNIGYSIVSPTGDEREK